MAAIDPPLDGHSQTSEEAVLDPNIGGALLDANDSAGNPGDVLTSQGPGGEPIWMPGGGGSGGSGTSVVVIDNLTSTEITAALSANQGRVLEEMKANDGPIGGSRLTAKPSKLVGNPAATEGPIGEITVGTGLTLAAGILSAEAGSGVTNLSVTGRTALTLTVDSDTGTDALIPAATDTLAGLISGPDQEKLNAIAPGATANLSDEELQDLANATGVLDGAQVEGLYTASGLTISAPQKLLGRHTAGAGKAQEITVGPGLELAAGVLSAVDTGGGAIGTNLSIGNVTATTVQVSSDTGTDAVIPAATATEAGVMSAEDKVKVAAIPADADYSTPDWNAAPGAPGEILNKPPIPDSPDDIGAASQSDLDALQTQVDAIPAAVTPDWNAAPGAPGEILNKPPLGTAAALDVGVADGVCPLDATAKVPAIHLPSYVDDVIEVDDFASLPATGDAGVIYVTADTGSIWRWSGTQYVEISPSPGTTDAVPEGSANLYYTDERATAAAEAAITDAALASQADLDALEAQVAAIPDPVKPDWDAPAGDPAEILNKPAIPASTDDLPEGTNNQYYSDDKVQALITIESKPELITEVTTFPVRNVVMISKGDFDALPTKDPETQYLVRANPKVVIPLDQMWDPMTLQPQYFFDSADEATLTFGVMGISGFANKGVWAASTGKQNEASKQPGYDYGDEKTFASMKFAGCAYGQFQDGQRLYTWGDGSEFTGPETADDPFLTPASAMTMVTISAEEVYPSWPQRIVNMCGHIGYSGGYGMGAFGIGCQIGTWGGGEGNVSNFNGRVANGPLDFEWAITSMSGAMTPEEGGISRPHYLNGYASPTAEGGPAPAPRVWAPGAIAVADRHYALGATANWAPMKGNLGAVLVFNKLLSEGELALCEGWLAWRYGKNLLLPLDHPFRQVPPAVDEVAPDYTHPPLVGA